jgi:phage terminase large subunit-like protein
MLQSRLKVLDTTKRIVRKDGGGFYAVLSADGDIQDGIEPSLALMDELHRWKQAKAETLYDVITKGTISRKEPLVVEITTAGEINDSPICWREHEFAQQVLAGSLKSDRFYPFIRSADPERVRKDPEYWKTREARVAANPSHEDNGGFLKDEALVEELDKAIAVPAARNAYLRYHLNLWVTSEERFIPQSDWAKCSGPVRSLTDRPCYIGVDLSSTTDLTSVVAVFPDTDGTFDILSWFWMAENQVAERERQDRVPYSTWAHQGYLEVTPGWAIDRREVAQKIKWCIDLYDVREVCYDPWHGTELAMELTDTQGAVCVKIPQNFAQLSEPTKKLAEICANGKLRHGNHPILNWNADCATVRSDSKDNLMLTKPDRKRSSKRIDGMAALVNAMVRALVAAKSQSELVGFY